MKNKDVNRGTQGQAPWPYGYGGPIEVGRGGVEIVMLEANICFILLRDIPLALRVVLRVSSYQGRRDNGLGRGNREIKVVWNPLVRSSQSVKLEVKLLHQLFFVTMMMMAMRLA